jgi:hypothetical protein
MINPTEIVKDILKFKGFRGATFAEKMKWLFLLYPFFIIVTVFLAVNRVAYATAMLLRRKK